MFFQYLISQTEPLQLCFPYSMPFFCQNSKNCHQVQQLKNVSEESKQTDSLPSDTQILKNQEEKELKICNSEKNQLNRKKNIKEKSEQNQEYNPKSSTHINKTRGKQNVLRNILPNIMHQACTFAQKKIRSHKYVQGLLKNGNVQEATVNRYYLYHTLIKEKNNNYLNEEAFKYFKIFHEPRCELFSAKEQEEYLRISRILIKRFLEQQLRSNVLTSSRMKNQTKNGHLKVLRRVMQHLHTTYRT